MNPSVSVLGTNPLFGGVSKPSYIFLKASGVLASPISLFALSVGI